MVKQFILILVPFLFVGCGNAENKPDLSNTAPEKDPLEEAVDWAKIQNRNGDAYLPNTDVPYSGWAKRTFENGQVEVLVQFDGGSITKIKRWQENGIPRFEAQFEEGAVNLSSKINDFEDFNISTFKGKALKWHSNGQKEQEFTVKDGNVSGISTMWHENGQKMGEVNFIQGEKNGKHITWFENGQKHWEQNFVKNVADGVLNEWYKNGQKRYEGSYVNDMMHGKWSEWYKNGQKKLQETYDHGLENGLITEWYENGFKKNERSFKRGNEDGNFSRWVINGQKWQQGFYKNGEEHGLYEEWHVGFAWISKSVGFPVKEEDLDPIWKQRNHKRLEIIFDEGKFVSAKGWKINGEECPETNLKDGFGIIVEYGDGGLVYERKTYVDGKEVELSVFEAKKKSNQIEKYTELGKASASHILVSYQGASRASPAVFRDKDSAKKEAERIRSLILIDGKDFAEMARFYSDGPSGPKGGDIGEFTYQVMAKSFSEATFALPVGGISEVVETEFGFHIIKRTPVKSIPSSVDASTAKPTSPPSFTPPTAPPSQVKP